METVIKLDMTEVRQAYIDGFSAGYNCAMDVVKNKLHEEFFAYDEHDWTKEELLEHHVDLYEERLKKEGE